MWFELDRPYTFVTSKNQLCAKSLDTVIVYVNVEYDIYIDPCYFSLLGTLLLEMPPSNVYPRKRRSCAHKML